MLTPHVILKRAAVIPHRKPAMISFVRAAVATAFLTAFTAPVMAQTPSPAPAPKAAAPAPAAPAATGSGGKLFQAKTVEGKECSAQADAQKLKGKERSKFRAKCIRELKKAAKKS
jgi:hypothetical protein